MDDSNNWDLQAVVRGCSSSAMAAVVNPFSSFAADEYLLEEFAQGLEDFDLFLDPITSITTSETTALYHELEQLCKPFFSISPQTVSDDPSPTKTAPEMQQQRPLSNNPSRSKRSRRNQQKKVVCQVPADVLPSDMWAWRKYGQKPIKGSPYPRGYYRCSSSKGCLARKQVERSRTDPSMLIITYTAEHNHAVPTHRNSLAGSTRNKFPQNLAKDNTDSKAEELSSAFSPLTAGLSPTTPLVASMEDIEGDQEEGGGAAVADATIGEMIGDGEEDMGFLDLEEDDDFVQSFFSESWKMNYSDGGS